MANKRKIGNDYEQRAAEYLRRQGFHIVGRNFYSRYGEIDIIAKDGECLVFVEVKYRRNASCGSPLEAVDARKQRRICRTASYFCVRHGYGNTAPCRFDVIGMTEEDMVHIKNAFEFHI